jgi:uncharacterized surface protein with fasciclin (FAS1) repeats
MTEGAMPAAEVHGVVKPPLALQQQQPPSNHRDIPGGHEKRDRIVMSNAQGMGIIKKLVISAALVSSLALSACGGSGGDGTAAADPTVSQTPMATESPMATETPMASAMVGAGCSAYAKQVPSGKGSVAGMAKDPVATAASNNPLLTTLVKAVSGKVNKKVDLVDTLNSDEFTVFAPVDSAFAKLPAKTVASLAETKNASVLTSILTYHVVPGQIAPDKIVGTQKTVQGETLKVTGSGDNLKVNGATVICGGVQTANATVYLIDTVMMPPSMMKK